MTDVAIIGAGIIGGAIAMELSKYDISVALIERETDVANGTTKANSGIIHAGYDPEPGTLMAKYNVRGNELAVQICRDLDVPFVQSGSLVLAFSEEDMETVRKLYRRGIENGVPDMRILDGPEVLQLEPAISHEVKGALYAKTGAVVSPFEYGVAMCENAVENGAALHLETEVTGIRKEEGIFVLSTNNPEEPELKAGYVINCAGLYGDVIHNMAAKPTFKILPNKGQYYLMDKSQGIVTKHVLFQCPNKDGKGVLVGPTAHGNLIVGPNAESLSDVDREGLGTTADGLTFVRKTALRTTEDINYRESIRNFAGLRANADTDDFIIAFAEDEPHLLDVAGIKSPGLTAAPAIAEDVARMLEESGLSMRKKEDWIGTRRMVRFASCSTEERQALVRENPLYGRIICRCETVTEGEILDLFKRPITPRTIDGVKRRCGAGMGRCQGGFCGPRVHEILSREMGVNPMEIRLDRAGSHILTGETKGGSQE